MQVRAMTRRGCTRTAGPRLCGTHTCTFAAGREFPSGMARRAGATCARRGGAVALPAHLEISCGDRIRAGIAGWPGLRGAVLVGGNDSG